MGNNCGLRTFREYRLGVAGRAVIGFLPCLVSVNAIGALPSDLTELPLEDLLNIEVTSVSKLPEALSEAAAAIYVVTGDDIRRSGARSIAEALRLVPGLHVARSNVSTQYYAISARGFNSGTADKLEVLLDGRSVYTPLFSGVFWDTLDTFLPDIERIEVIRGPGASLWGANAVNGVINIVTKDAAATSGGHVSAGGGDAEIGFAEIRSGGSVGRNGHVRAYAKAQRRDDAHKPDGSDLDSRLNYAQGGLRGDWHAGKNHTTVSGDAYTGTRGSGTGDIDLSGANVLGHWRHHGADHSDVGLKVYLDHYERAIPTAYKEDRNTLDLDFQHHLRLGDLHSVVYGLGYRYTEDKTGGPPLAFIFDPQNEDLHTYSAFVQDQIPVGRGELTVGSKFEHNDYTGFEVQPSIRFGWAFEPRLFGWAAVSRAVRTPNRLDTSLSVFCPPNFPVCDEGERFLIGKPDLDSEKLVAYELGLRAWTAETLSLDVALFYNDYDQLRSSEPSSTSPFGTYGNGLEGVGQGGEANLVWQASNSLRLRLFYSYLYLDLGAKASSADVTGTPAAESSAPRHNGGLDWRWEIRPRVTLDGLIRRVGSVKAGNIPPYSELNVRFAYQVNRRLQVSLAGQNLLHDQHAEYGSPGGLEVIRSVFAQMDWTWE